MKLVKYTHWQDTTENTILVCKTCLDHYGPEDVESIGGTSFGDESWNICPTCGQVEGKTISLYETKSGSWVPENEIDWND